MIAAGVSGDQDQTRDLISYIHILLKSTTVLFLRNPSSLGPGLRIIMDRNSRLRGAQLQIGYYLTNERKLEEALQAPGANCNLVAGDIHLPEGNKRLALVGDAVLRMVFVEHGYNTSEFRGNLRQHSSPIHECVPAYDIKAVRQ